MKTCKCGCGYPVFSHGYSKYCQYKRTDDKKPKYSKLRITQVKDFCKTPNFGFESELDMFNWLWENAHNKKGDVICKYTNEKLNRFYNTLEYFSCFAHVLPKGRYTYFKLNPKNVEIVLPDFHLAVDQGTLAGRAKHPTWRFDVWDTKVIEMKQKYAEFKKQNLLP